MSQRTTRVNELIKREISSLLHTRYQNQATLITITGVETAPDLRKARVYFSVLGDASDEQQATLFFKRKDSEIRKMISKAIILKYLPALEFVLDQSIQRGVEINQIIEDLDIPEPDPDNESQ